MADYLYHHGIKGMKWGVRRYQNEDGSYTEAGKKRYSDEQYRRDTRVYGRGAANRIRRRVNDDGESVSGARSAEADGIASARRAAKATGKTASAFGYIGGALTGAALSVYVQNLVDDTADPLVQSYVTAGTIAVTAGLASIGGMAAENAARSTVMASRGYRPSKYR